MSDALPVEITQHYPLPLAQLSAGWERVWLADIASSVSPGFASGKHSSDGKGVPHLRPMNVDRDGQVDLAVVKSVASSEGVELAAGDVLFNNTNSPELVGKTALISEREEGFAYSNHMTRIRLEPDVVPAFVARQLHFLWMSGYLKTRCTNHVNQASISSTTLSSTVPLLLAPAAEQKRIVERLEAALSDLDDGVKELKAAQKKLARYRQVLLKAAVDGGLTSEWRRQHSQSADGLETGAQLLERILDERRSRWEAAQLKKYEEQGRTPPKDWSRSYKVPVAPVSFTDRLIPDTWTWATIDQVSIEQRYGSSSKTGLHRDGVPVIRMGNIQDAELVLEDLKYLPKEHDEFPELLLKDGDLLFNRTNSPELVGKCAVYRSQISPCSYASYLIAVRFTELYVPELAAAYINSLYGRQWIKEVATQQVGQANVNGTKLAALTIPLPPHDEQIEISRLLSDQLAALKLRMAEAEAGLRLASAQRRNVLRAAFSGMLVGQDPADDPASLALQRIRARRVEQGPRPSRRQRSAKKEISSMAKKLREVLSEAADWLPAQEAFLRCGIADGSGTDEIEGLYAELRALDKSKRLAVEVVTDAQGRKLHDRLRLLPAA